MNVFGWLMLQLRAQAQFKFTQARIAFSFQKILSYLLALSLSLFHIS